MHPLVTQLFRGVYNSRPPKPRYSCTWDVDLVVRHLKELGNNEVLSLKILSRKLALLMALTLASRTSELQALDLRFRYFRPEGVLFRLASLTKKRKVGASPKECFFRTFLDDNNLCVVQCLQQYEKLTQSYRHSTPDTPQPLFISYVKPHKPVSSQRLAHWIKDMLAGAGIDTKTFKAHSVRGASSSAALRKGVHISDILRTADWSKDSTFKRFYYRPVADDNYASKVLN